MSPIWTYEPPTESYAKPSITQRIQSFQYKVLRPYIDYISNLIFHFNISKQFIHTSWTPKPSSQPILIRLHKFFLYPPIPKNSSKSFKSSLLNSRFFSRKFQYRHHCDCGAESRRIQRASLSLHLQENHLV